MQGARAFNTDEYKYGFNGKENDNEVVGTGSGTQDYGMRIYNPALGKFLSVDPLQKDYPELTPYQFASNTPIESIDLDGLEAISVKVAFPKAGKPLITVSAKMEYGPFGLGVSSARNSLEFNGQLYFYDSPSLLTQAGIELLKNPVAFEQNNISSEEMAGIAVVAYSILESTEHPIEYTSEANLNAPKNYNVGAKKPAVRANNGVDSDGENVGTIYKVDGKYTTSGKPYIGRHNKPAPQQTRKSNDGRDRKKAVVIDTYDNRNTQEGQYKEQKAMDAEGGLPSLDNKRREVNEKKMKELDKTYGESSSETTSSGGG